MAHDLEGPLHQLSLFGAGGIPQWRADETLYSLACRYHKLSGTRDPRETSKRLFGRVRGGAQHDFPSGLDHFAAATQACLGHANEIAMQRTLLRFYLPFRRPDDGVSLLRIATSDRTDVLKARLGLLAGGFGARHPLKACPDCMREDEGSFSSSHWRLAQQFPSSLTCLVHNRFLCRYSSKSPLMNRYAWVLPDHDSLEPIGSMTRPLAPLAVSITTAGLGLMAPGFTFDPLRFSRAVSTNLRVRGLLTPNGSIRVAELAPEYLRLCRDLRSLGVYGGPVDDIEAARVRLSTLLRVSTLPMQPMGSLMVCLLVFRTWDSFKAAYDAMSHQSLSTSEPPQSSLERVRRSEARQIESDSGASRQLVTALAQAGTVRRAALSLGWGRQRFQAALRNDPSIRERAAAIRFNRTRAQMRQDYVSARREGIVSAAAIREKYPATYAWLYRHDRHWLTAHTPARRLASSNYRQVDWIERDESLARQVEANGAAIIAVAGGVIPTRRHVELTVPAFRPSALRRLPRTRQALRKIGVRLREVSADHFARRSPLVNGLRST